MNPVVRRARRRAAAARSRPGRTAAGRARGPEHAYTFTGRELRKRLGIPPGEVIIALYDDGTGGRYTIATVSCEHVSAAEVKTLSAS